MYAYGRVFCSKQPQATLQAWGGVAGTTSLTGC